MTDRKDRDQEKFLQRWSRLKRAGEVPTRDGSEPSPRKPSDADSGSLPQTPAQGGVDLPAFDPSTLPPIESISASSDIRAFLAPGVPEEFKRAALRRAWIMDPAIRDFVGVAENQWDFNKPGSIPGFGSLELTPELCRIVASLFSDSTAENMPSRLTGTEPRKQTHVHETLAEPPSSAMASPPCERDAQAGGSPASVEEVHADQVHADQVHADQVHADPVGLASREPPPDETLQPILSKQKASKAK
jgi:hypothetical protein